MRLADVGLLDRRARSRRGAPATISPATVKQLRLRWFFNTRDVVTAHPGGRRRHAVRRRLVRAASTRCARATASRAGRSQAKPQRLVYSGQIVASAAVADVRGDADRVRPVGQDDVRAARVRRPRAVAPRARRARRPERPDRDRVVTGRRRRQGDLRLGRAQLRARATPPGVVALDARTGRQRWKLVTAPSTGRRRGPPAPGCGDVWGSPSVDRARGLVIFGTGNCTDAPRAGGASATRWSRST